MESGGQFLRAKYAFRGMAASLDATVPLGADKPVILSGLARWQGQGLPRTAFVRLGDETLSLLLHFAFRSDQVIDIPRSAIHSVRWHDGVAEFDYRLSSGADELLRLTNWRSRFGTPVRPINCEALARVLGGHAA